MKKKIFSGICILLFILSFTFAASGRMGSQNFQIQTSVLSGGGVAMSSTNFQMNSTLGQSSPVMAPDGPPGSENYVSYPGFWYTIDIVLTEELIAAMDLHKGWSMISLPLTPYNAKLSGLFPEAVVLYCFDEKIGYDRITEEEALEVGMGYWILLDQNQNYMLTGQPVNTYTLPVYKDGWDMIGGCSCPAQAFSGNSDIIVIYDFVPGIGYQRVLESENLMPGKGYWILIEDVIGQANLTLECDTE